LSLCYDAPAVMRRDGQRDGLQKVADARVMRIAHQA
jgi:hypothetical protein